MTIAPHNLPKGFAEMMTELLGKDETRQLLTALDNPSPTTIRLSQRKSLGLDLSQIGGKAVPWCPWGYYLPERPLFTGDPLFHAGYFYVQEASSMLLYQVGKLLPDTSLTALDLCAAPGGKSTLLLDLLPVGSVLVSNEVVGHRANILAENLQKWGSPMSIVTSAYPECWGQLTGIFDLMLVDAPCSGEGMFRKDLEARAEWAERSPMECAERQRSILTDVWPSLASGGYLVYSTCTFNRLENEDIVAFIVEELGGEVCDLELNIEGVVRSPLSPYACYRMMPHCTAGEGLFMAVIRKSSAPQGREDSRRSLGKKSRPLPKNPIYREVAHWIGAHTSPWQWREEGETLYAYPSALEPLLGLLAKNKIRTLSFGIPVATTKGKKPTPHPALAYSQYLDQDAFDIVGLSYDEAIAYLAKEALTLSSELPQGIKLLTYRSIPLGFVKHLGNRCNSLLPTEWRIRQPERVRSSINTTSSTFGEGSCLCQYLTFD